MIISCTKAVFLSGCLNFKMTVKKKQRSTDEDRVSMSIDMNRKTPQ